MPLVLIAGATGYLGNLLLAKSKGARLRRTGLDSLRAKDLADIYAKTRANRWDKVRSPRLWTA